MDGMQAIILAGGESTRFWPLSHKALFPFFGKPLLALQYERLSALGIQSVTVVANDQNVSDIKRVSVPGGMHVTVVVQKDPAQGGALIAARESVPSGPAIVLNASDIYQTGTLKALVESPFENGVSAILGAMKTKQYFPGGYLSLDWEGNLGGIVEKPQPGSEPSDIIRIVADKFTDVALLYGALEKVEGNPPDQYEQALNILISEPGAVKPMIVPGGWSALKYPWDVLPVMEVLLSEFSKPVISKTAVIRPGVIIEGPVVIEDGVKVFEGTKIVGPCYIGKETIIGNNNIVRDSHIGAHCVTGFNSDITRSYVGDNCWFHTNYVGDSVLAGNVSMGSGAVLANLRLDDGEIRSTVKNEPVNTGRKKLGSVIGTSVRIGVNASIMPGIKIGSDSFVGSGLTVSEDVPSHMYCKPVKSYEVVENTSSAAADRDTFRSKL